MYKYTVTQSTTLEKIVHQFYKDVSKTPQVLEHNPKLKNKLILEVGDIVNLPVLKEKKSKESVKRLWD